MNQESRKENMESVITEQVEILSEGSKLDGTLFLPTVLKEKHKAALFVHGWKSGQDSDFRAATTLAEDGFVSLTFNMRGHGMDAQKPENYSRQNFLNDVTAAYDFLVAREDVDPSRIIVAGSSMGAYLTTILSEKRLLKGCVLRVPADYQDDGFDKAGLRGSDFKDVIEWRKQIHDDKETMSLRALKKFSGDVLIVESGNDTMVPHETVQSYANVVDENNLTYKLMLDAGHSIKNDEDATKEYGAIIHEWTSEKIKDNE